MSEYNLQQIQEPIEDFCMTNITPTTESVTPATEITWSINRTPDFRIIESVNTVNEERNENINSEVIDYAHNFRYFNQPLPEAVTFNNSKKNIQIKLSELEISEEDKNCCICMEIREKVEICSLNCNHKFCGFCLESCFKKSELNCSLCRGNVTVITTQKTDFKNRFQKCCILYSF